MPLSDLHLEGAFVDLLACVDVYAVDAAGGALNAIDFSIAAPAIVGVISPQRSSIDLLLDVLTGFRRPTTGAAYLAGRRIDGLSAPAMARAGLVRTMSRARLPVNATVEDYLSLVLQLRQSATGTDLRRALVPFRPARSGRIDTVLELVGLADCRRKAAGGLDHDRRARLEVARALLQQPKVVVADRIFCYLAGDQRNRLATVLQTVHRSGIALLVADHDTLTLSSICQRVLAFHNGRLIADGAPDEVGGRAEVQAAFTGVEMDRAATE